MFYGIDALLHGAMVAMAAAVPGVILFWRATAPMRGGSCALRALLISLASWGVMLLAAGAFAIGWERRGFADEALAGGAMGGGALAILLFLVLWPILPRGPTVTAP